LTPLLLTLVLAAAPTPTVAELEAIVGAPDEERTRVERDRAAEALAARGDTEAVRALIRLLSDDEGSRFALDQLDELKTPAAVPELVKLRRSSDKPRHRSVALRALRELDAAAAFDELLDEAARGTDLGLRRSALGWAARDASSDAQRERAAKLLLKEAAGVLGDAARQSADELRPMPRPLLEPALRDKAEARRTVACEGAGRDALDLVAKALPRQQHRMGQRACARRLMEDADAVPELAAPALLDYGLRNNDLFFLDKATEKLPHTVAPAVVERLLPLLDEQRVPSRVGDILEWAGEPAAAEALARRYERTEAHVWLSAYAASIETEAQLTRLLSWRERARYGFPNALAAIRHPSLAPHLVPLLRDDDVNVRSSTARVLGRLAVEDTAVPLLDAATRDPVRRVRNDAAASLAYVASEDALGRMAKHLKKGDHPHLARPFVRTSRVFGHKQTRRLLRRRDHQLAYRILNAILHDVHPSDEGILLDQAGARDFSRRQLAVIGLGSLHTPRARATLCKLLKKDRRIRSTAARSLAQFRDLNAVDCLIAQLTRSTPRKEPSTHDTIQGALRYATGENLKGAAAWRAWRKSGASGKRSTAEWIAALDDESADVRALAANQIGARFERARDKAKLREEAGPALIAALVDERHDDALRAEARAVERVGVPLAGEALVAALEHAPRRDARRAIIRALDSIGDGRGTLRLVRELDSHDPATRQRAAEDLAIITAEPLHYDVGRWRAWWKKHAERYRR
jgi:HEAT repeat protein